jgi:xylulose-5-phosphate/fructose-6-phosphate phosphoketolase
MELLSSRTHYVSHSGALGHLARLKFELRLHLNRLIREQNADVIYLAGPGHGDPAVVANVYLEGTYSEIYPNVTQDERGLHRLFRQFSTPGGIPSHVSAPTPGSIHEGGELGYVLVHAFGAAVFDNPDLIAVAVVGDGEADTGPLAGSWKSTGLPPLRSAISMNALTARRLASRPRPRSPP